jgi:hypothetical protein
MGTGGRVTNPKHVTDMGIDVRTGKKRQITLADAVRRQMLPTPAARDWKSGTGRQENGHTPQLPEVIGGQLNPQFVSWLMGFPVDWCDMPEERAEEPQTESPNSDA